MICTKHTLSSLSLSLCHTHRQSIIRWTVAAEIKKNNCRNNVKMHVQEIRWHSIVWKLAGCVESVCHQNIVICWVVLSTMLNRDNPGLLCLFVLLYPIIWLNDDILIIVQHIGRLYSSVSVLSGGLSLLFCDLKHFVQASLSLALLYHLGFLYLTRW